MFDGMNVWPFQRGSPQPGGRGVVVPNEVNHGFSATTGVWKGFVIVTVTVAVMAWSRRAWVGLPSV
jgi:hypothetical protein